MRSNQKPVIAPADVEDALRNAEALNRQFVESTGDCVKILDLDGRILYINQAGLRMLELPDASGLLNHPIASFFDGHVRRSAESAVAAARRGEQGLFQYVMSTTSGQVKWWDAVVTPITDRDGTIVQLLAISRDVTQRRQEEAFRFTQHQVLEMIATGNPLPAVLDRVALMVEEQCDGMFCTILLLDEDGTTVRHGAAPSLPSGYVRAINGLSIGPSEGSCGTAMYRGTRVIVTDIQTDPLWEKYRAIAQEFSLGACWSTPIFSPQRKVLGSFAMYYGKPRTPTEDELRLIDTAAGIARIAIEQQRASEALQHSEARNRAILRAIPDWMFLTTVDGVFLDFHARDVSRLVVPPAAFMGRTVSEILPPSVAEPLTQAFRRVSVSDEPENVEYTIGADDDERFYEACVVSCDGDKILSIVRDITDRKRSDLELDAQRRQLAHLGRVSMLGELSGTLAHELSQPLTAILSNAQAARHRLDRETPDLDALRAMLDDIIKANRRAGAVIDRLRALLRKSDTAMHPVDLNDVARDVLDLAYGELTSRRVTTKTCLAPELPLVLGDRIQLQQVILNLVLNACEAMNGTEASLRQISVSTRVDGGTVEVILSDRGSGIPPDQLERVFEPFVTFGDQGLGLGLAISRSIVAAHGGSIRAENNPARGATFRCRLPISRG